jgi:hypothetical protein
MGRECLSVCVEALHSPGPPLYLPLIRTSRNGESKRHNGVEAFGWTGRAVHNAVFLPVKLTTVEGLRLDKHL